MNKPELGSACDKMKKNGPESLWPILRAAIEQLAGQVDFLCIPCNSLHFYEEKIKELVGSKFVSIIDTTSDYLTANELSKVALLGTNCTTDLHALSAFRRLQSRVQFEIVEPEILQQLIRDIKRLGTRSELLALNTTFEELLGGLTSPVALLACTELPLLSPRQSSVTLVDLNQLLADRMAALARPA